MTVTYLKVTGANRGIGLGFVKALSARPDTRIIATARDTAKATDLNAVAQGAAQKNVEVVKWDANTAAEDSRVVKEVIERLGGGLDVFINNAGFAINPASVIATKPESLSDHIKGNIEGPLHLFQAVYKDLEASTQPGGGLFYAITSNAASLGQPLPFPNLGYGVAKVVLNFLGVSIALQHPKIRVILAHPGFVRTDLSKAIVGEFGFELDSKELESYGLVTVDESVKRQLENLIDKAQDIKSGSYVDKDGQTLPW